MRVTMTHDAANLIRAEESEIANQQPLISPQFRSCTRGESEILVRFKRASCTRGETRLSQYHDNSKDRERMAPATKRKSEYKSDHFVLSDDEEPDSNTHRPSKKGKTAGSDFKPSSKPHVEKNGETWWEISKSRRVTISEFKSKQMINVREYYEKDGQSLPGKKVSEGVVLCMRRG
jgi:hypothetical protein